MKKKSIFSTYGDMLFFDWHNTTISKTTEMIKNCRIKTISFLSA